MKKRILFLTAVLGSFLPLKVKATTEGISISCDGNNTVMASSSITCKITGYTNSAVSGLQFHLTSDSLATISNIRVASIWQGDGEDGNIGVYTDTNKTGIFDIATFTLTAKDTGGTAHIYANDIIFSDASFNIISYENQTQNVTIQNTPSNPAFKDWNFYKCVINSYNGSIFPGIPYTTNLTDEQLNTITSLDCNGNMATDADKITDVTGIEKLTQVNNVNLSNHKISTIDITKNSRLLNLNISNNRLTNITFNTNNVLTVLNVSNNNLNSLNISPLKNLSALYISGNPITSLNILENVRLYTLEANDNVSVPLTRVQSNIFPIQNHVIKNIPLNTNVEAIKDIFYFKNENYNYTFIDPRGTKIQEKKGSATITNADAKITTGTKYTITFRAYKEEYTLMLKGDITGTGELGISDIARLYQFYKKKVSMDEIYVLAGDTDNDGTIQVNDIAKLYQFYKNKIPSLN